MSMLDKLKPYIPPRIEPALVGLWHRLRPIIRIAFRGDARYCAVCDSSSRAFLSHGPPSRRRDDVMCPVCLSHDRHRSAWLYFSTQSTLLDRTPRRMLHFAPEAELTRAFRNVPGLDYLSADLNSPHAMLRTDITDIDAPDASFDLVYCSHVLEHVPDDGAAMKEMHRVLRPGGWALIQVPLAAGAATIEDPNVTDPAERERLYWQHDHVRLYGDDIADRLAAAGFHVQVVTPADFIDPASLERQGLWSDERLFVCTRPVA
jgi:SAM-dependent methyltransferase